jgi:holo-[acyl-carrier protein] synthase
VELSLVIQRNNKKTKNGEMQMIRGIGVDTVNILEMENMLRRITEGAVEKIYTAEELAASRRVYNASEYLATRFAAKEAVFKAVAHLLEKGHFDLRIVETLNHDDGSPYVNTDNGLADILKRAGVGNILISITTEGNLATAFVVAE